MFINIWKGLTRTLNWVILILLCWEETKTEDLKLCGCNERPAEYLRLYN